MKKIWMTLCAVALIAAGATAQQREKQEVRELPTQEETEKNQQKFQEKSEALINEVEEEAEQAEETRTRQEERRSNQLRSTDEGRDVERSQANETTRIDAAAFEEIEVHESKEGPNGEVVYKYRGDLFIVDREQGAFVKVDESKLRDSEHQLKITQTRSDDDN